MTGIKAPTSLPRDSARTPERGRRMQTIETDVIVIGAGPAGLCLARALDGSGLRVAVLERESETSLRKYLTRRFAGRQMRHDLPVRCRRQTQRRFRFQHKPDPRTRHRSDVSRETQ